MSSEQISDQAWELAAAKKATFVQWEEEAYPDVYRHYFLSEDVEVLSEEALAAQAELERAREVTDAEIWDAIYAFNEIISLPREQDASVHFAAMKSALKAARKAPK